MALSDSAAAIGAVTELLQTRLIAQTTVATTVGRPETAAGSTQKLNLFLYQIELDGNLRNRPYDTGQATPLWLVLRYLLTAFDASGESDSIDAHGLLGTGMLALQELNFLRSGSLALADNPEPLKVTFDAGDAELLSKLMQGAEEHYRLSIAFQVRPVMVVPTELPSYAPLVTSVGPPGAEGVFVAPTLGPTLDAVQPSTFSPGNTLTLTGSDLSSELHWVCFDEVCYPVTAAPSGRLQVVVPADTELSAGNYAVTAVRELPSGRRRSTNAVLASLMPGLVGASHGPLTADVSGNLSGALTLSGDHLGGPDDAIFVGFYREGKVRLMLEATGTPAQSSLLVSVPADEALLPGLYHVILRVNGVQASVMPEVDWS